MKKNLKLLGAEKAWKCRIMKCLITAKVEVYDTFTLVFMYAIHWLRQNQIKES